MKILEDHKNELIKTLMTLLGEIPGDSDSLEDFLRLKFGFTEVPLPDALLEKVLRQNELKKELGSKNYEKITALEAIVNGRDVFFDIQNFNLRTKNAVIGIINQIVDLYKFDITLADLALEEANNKIKLHSLRFNNKNIKPVPNQNLYHKLLKEFEKLQNDLEQFVESKINNLNKKFQGIRLEIVKVVPGTVFGDNLMGIKTLFDWMKYYMIAPGTDPFHFFFQFNPNANSLFDVINLSKGKLADHVLLIDELEPLFAVQLRRTKGDYYSWWCQRFLFKGKNKTKEDISKISNKIRSGENSSSLKDEIQQLVKDLQAIPQ